MDIKDVQDVEQTYLNTGITMNVVAGIVIQVA
jgi:hypothetical protein